MDGALLCASKRSLIHRLNHLALRLGRIVGGHLDGVNLAVVDVGEMLLVIEEVLNFAAARNEEA